MPRRSRPSRRTLTLIANLLILLVVAGLWACNQILGEPDGSPTAIPISTPSGGGWYQLYFTDPATTAGLDNPTGGLPAVVAASFAEAQRTIDAAIYEIDLQIYADALIAAHQRGVAVRLVTDTDYLDEAPMEAVRAAGIAVVPDDRSGLMHNKFVVIDGVTIWTGSMNFTFNDAYRNDNNYLRLSASRLARNYTNEFDEMFGGGFGVSDPNTPYPMITVDGTLIETYFSPDDRPAARLTELLRSARSSIYFMAFAFTRADLTEAMVERARAGVTVQGVFESRQLAAGADSAWQVLRTAQIDVREDGNSFNLHHKVILIDRQIVVTGSYNFSNSAEERNNENLLIIHNAEMAEAYFAEWQRVWAAAKP